jgi:ABC-type multidrug transport system fused ATPase/permease subunit
VEVLQQGNPILQMYRTLWHYSPGNRGKIILHAILIVIANLFDFFPPLILAKILNIIQLSGLNEATLPVLLWWCAAFIGVEIGFWIFHGPARVIELSIAFTAAANYKQDLVDSVMHKSANWHTDHHSGDTIDKIEKASNGLKEFGSRSYEIIQAIIRLLGSYLALIYFNLSSSYIVLFIIIITFTMIIQFDKYLITRFKQINLFQNEISAKVYDVVSNITTVIILRIENLVSKNIAQKLHLPYEYDRKTNKVIELKWFLVSLTIMIMLFAVIASYFFSSIKTEDIIMIGTVSALFNYVNRIGSIFYNFAYRYGDIVKWHTAVASAEHLIIATEKEKKQAYPLKKGWKKIEIRDLSFSYQEDKKKLHLDNISMTIKRKQRIALIGASGSGKTTTLKLIRELYQPKTCQIFVDGTLLPQGFSAISEDISLLPQEPELFATTIKENITLGLPATAQEIKKYTDLALFSEVVARLPSGLESSIVERGVNLSGGEKQRLALARGLMFSADKEIIMLDEPTSSVDAKNELAIYKNIFTEFKEQTILSSIHRLHLLPLFDQIYFFHKGKLIAVGSYKKLLRSSPEFRKLIQQYQKTQKH